MESPIHPPRQRAGCLLGDNHASALRPRSLIHLFDLVCMAKLRVRAGHRCLGACNDLDLAASLEVRFLALRLAVDVRLEFVSTPTKLIVNVAPVLNVAVTTVTLCLSSTEAQSFISSLEGAVEVMNDGDNERLGTTTICSCERTCVYELAFNLDADPIEVDISKELERRNVTLANWNARDVNTEVVFYEAMKLVVGLRSLDVQLA